MTLKPGDKGPAVESLQRNLIALGYKPGAIDGDYGPTTTAAVLAFQLDYSDVDDDGIAGPQTDRKMAAVLSHVNDATKPPTLAPAAHVRCNEETWAAFSNLVDLVTHTPVRYGPGRGLWHDGRFVVTHGPGALGADSWKNFLGKPYPSFHCTSWTNFVVGWILRRNELYTNAGNIPDLFDLLSQSASMHEVPQDGWTLRYRGYGDACTKIAPDGSGAKRSGVANVVDARELYARRESLPSFVVCGQSTKQANGWKWWHHTVMFVTRRDRLYRIAADGYRDAKKGYSAQPMKWAEITPSTVGLLDGAIYRAYAVNPNADGSYGDSSKPIAKISIET